MNPKTNKKPTQPKIPNIMNQIVIAIFIFMAITVAYTFFTKKGDDVKKMAISDVAKSVVDGTI